MEEGAAAMAAAMDLHVLSDEQAMEGEAEKLPAMAKHHHLAHTSVHPLRNSGSLHRPHQRWIHSFVDELRRH